MTAFCWPTFRPLQIRASSIAAARLPQVFFWLLRYASRWWSLRYVFGWTLIESISGGRLVVMLSVLLGQINILSGCFELPGWGITWTSCGAGKAAGVSLLLDPARERNQGMGSSVRFLVLSAVWYSCTWHLGPLSSVPKNLDRALSRGMAPISWWTGECSTWMGGTPTGWWIKLRRRPADQGSPRSFKQGQEWGSPSAELGPSMTVPTMPCRLPSASSMNGSSRYETSIDDSISFSFLVRFDRAYGLYGFLGSRSSTNLIVWWGEDVDTVACVCRHWIGSLWKHKSMGSGCFLAWWIICSPMVGRHSMLSGHGRKDSVRVPQMTPSSSILPFVVTSRFIWR